MRLLKGPIYPNEGWYIPDYSACPYGMTSEMFRIEYIIAVGTNQCMLCRWNNGRIERSPKDYYIKCNNPNEANPIQ